MAYVVADNKASSTLLACIFLSVTFYIVYALRHKSSDVSPAETFTNSLPHVGPSEGRFRWVRAVLQSITGSEQMVNDGYDVSTKSGRLFVLPTLSAGPVVLLPPEHLHILNRSENQVAGHETQYEIIQPRYTMARDKALYEDTINAGFGVVWKHLTRPKDVGRFSAGVENELAVAFDQYLGTNRNEEWKTCKVFESCVKIIGRAANRSYFGLPLCRDEKLLEQVCCYAEAVFGAAAMISVFPAWLRPVVGPLIAAKAQFHLAACRRILLPYIQSRLESTMKSELSEVDILQLLIDDARKHSMDRLNAVHLTYSLLAINQSSIYSTASVLTNCIFDLFSSARADEFVQSMRDEGRQVSERHGGSLASTAALHELRCFDSCIKESLRHGGFNTVAVMRKISAPHGIELDGLGTIPMGVRFGAPILSIHFDERFYPSPAEFDALRFCSRKEEHEVDSNAPVESAYLDRKTSSTNVSRDYLPWGYGKHACPGRWMAVDMLKLALVYLLENYDVEALKERPKNKPMLNVVLPPTDATIRLRRRQ